VDEETDMKVTVGVGGGVVISSVALEAGGLLIIDFLFSGEGRGGFPQPQQG